MKYTSNEIQSAGAEVPVDEVVARLRVADEPEVEGRHGACRTSCPREEDLIFRIKVKRENILNHTYVQSQTYMQHIK